MNEDHSQDLKNAEQNFLKGILRSTFYLAVPALLALFLHDRFPIFSLRSQTSSLIWFGGSFIFSWILIIADYKTLSEKNKKNNK